MSDDTRENFDSVLDVPIWGASAIGKILNISPRQTYHLLERSPPLIDADRVGGRWCSTRRRLLRPFTKARVEDAK
jgi:hypothetical protein